MCTHKSYNYKNPPSVCFYLIPILKSPFSNQAVLMFLLEWRSSVQAARTIVDWQDRLTLDPPWVSCPPLCGLRCRGRQDVSIKWLRCFVGMCRTKLLKQWGFYNKLRWCFEAFDTVLYCAIWWSIKIPTPSVIQMICSLGCHCKVYLYINKRISLARWWRVCVQWYSNKQISLFFALYNDNKDFLFFICTHIKLVYFY